MRFLKYLPTLFIITILMSSCGKKETKYPNVPSLRLIQQNTDKINYYDENAALQLQFEVIDGDGDLAKRNPIDDSSIIAIVYRTNDFSDTRYKFSMPKVDKDDFMKNGGLKASMHINMANYYFFPRLDEDHLLGLDTMSLGFYVQDYAGNCSDTIIVGPIYMEP